MKPGTKMQCTGWLLLFAELAGVRYCNSLPERPLLVLRLLSISTILIILLIMLGYQRNHNNEFSGILPAIKSFSIRQKMLLIGWSGIILCDILLEHVGNHTLLIILISLCGFLIEIAVIWSLILFLKRLAERWIQKEQLKKMQQEIRQQMQPEIPQEQKQTQPVFPQEQKKTKKTSSAGTKSPSEQKSPKISAPPESAGNSSNPEVICKRCGRIMHNPEEYDKINSDIYCKHCLDVLTSDMRTCAECNETHLKSSMVYIDGVFYCESCVEKMMAE